MTTTTSFTLNETQPAEDETNEILEKLHWNLTVFEPLQNGTIIINATKILPYKSTNVWAPSL